MVAMIYFGTRAIKNHITYPRTGFVAYRKQNRIWTAIVASVVSALSVVGLVLAAHSHRHIVMPVFFIGLFFAAGYVFGIARSGGVNALFRWKWVVVLAQVIGSLLIALLPEDLSAALAYGPSVPAGFSASSAGAFLLWLILYGTLLLISGAISFSLYLLHTQSPTEEANEPANADVQ
jgi:peptidoglycan/LPS O-acetylase OafA/YrhL